MSKLWDALKKAEGESKEEVVSRFDNHLADDEYSGNLKLTIPSSISEQYRKLLNAAKHSSNNGSGSIRSILVTSSNSGEGTSTIASSLAASLARDHRRLRVLLLDANIRKPSIHKIFSLSISPGLVEAVLEPDAPQGIFRRSPLQDIPNINIMTAGNASNYHYNPAEIIESDDFQALFSKIRDLFDLIIVDCAPVNPFSDVMSMAAQADGTLLVVNSQETRWEVAKQVQAQLEDSNANPIGVILNKRVHPIPQQLYKKL